MKTNIAVIYGCRSVEHEVSIISAVQAMRSIDRNKYDVIPIYVSKKGEMYTGDMLFDIEVYSELDKLFESASRICLLREGGNVVARSLDNTFFKKKKDIRIDVAFPIVHGTNCEDGTVAGLLEYLDLPYVGCDILSAAVGMDKVVFKNVLASKGLPVLDCVSFRAREYAQDKERVLGEIKNEIGFPLIIKPVNLGSSVGISKVNNEDELEQAIALAVSFSEKVLAERAITNLREINCSVLGDPDECVASVCEEPFMHDEILSYEDKYMSGGSKKSGGSKGMASLSRKIPADISEEKADEIKHLACDIFRATGSSGVVRIDFMLDTATDKVYANEINTIPGSLAFYLWEASGLSYTDMIDRLVEIAFRRQRTRENLTFTIDTNILSGVSFGTKGAKGSKL
ncbi:MAG: D-alanine--D-alanine ligase [Clostridia bacterium]|nr:D-alanine--D-alanine ligase [Clostridia bacterium]